MGVLPLSVTAQRPPQTEAIAVIHHAVECGVTLFDTADSYCLDDTEMGHNERVLGAALAQLSNSLRQRLTIATKGGLIRPGGRWERDGRPQHLRRRCEQSLKNLRVERIDLYQYHAPDEKVPLRDSIDELRRLREEGKVEHLGVSNFSVPQLDLAQQTVEIISIQNQYSPGCREPEKDGTLADSQQRGLAFLPWSPLGGSGRAKHVGQNRSTLQAIASDHHASVQQVVLAWLLSKGPMVFPIPGASQKATIEDSAKAAELELSPQELRRLEAAW